MDGKDFLEINLFFQRQQRGNMIMCEELSYLVMKGTGRIKI